MFSTNTPPEEIGGTDRRQTLYLNGRPVWGSHIYDLESYGEKRTTFLAALRSIQERGGIVAVPFNPLTERSALTFLNIAMGGMSHDGIPVQFTQRLDAPMLMIPGTATVWLIHHADAFPDLKMVMGRWLRPGRVAILTAATATLDLLMFEAPSVLFPDFDEEPEELGERMQEAVQTDNSILAETEWAVERKKQYAKIRRQVALFDAWGAPLPYELLARSLEMDEDDLATAVEELYLTGEEGVLYWVEREKPPTLKVATKSEGYARRYLADLSKKGQGPSLDDYRSFVRAIHPEDIGERYAMLLLIQGLLANSSQRWHLGGENFGIGQIIDFVKESWGSLKAIVHAGSPTEMLLWGMCLTNLGWFEQGNEIFKKGLRKDKKNIYLLQAQARLLGLWSRLNPARGEEAAQAFDRAVKIDKNNKHIWQAWGVFEAERHNWQVAEFCFRKTLELEPANIHALASRADMYLDMGDPEKAKASICEALKIDPKNLHAIHIDGRIDFYNGEWKKAEGRWRSMLDVDKRNIYARQSIAHMARKRGHWKESCDQLQDALKIDPENEAVLLEMALLKQDTGSFESSVDLREKAWKEARVYLGRAMSAAPWSPKASVALAVLERQSGELQAAKERLQKLRSRLPNNVHIRHALALCKPGLGDMIAELKSMNKDQGGKNLPVRISLAEAMIRSGQTEQAKDLLREIAPISVAEAMIRDGKTEPINDLLGKIAPSHLQAISAIDRIEAFLETARLYTIMHEMQKADLLFKAVVLCDPENRNVRRWILRYYHGGQA